MNKFIVSPSPHIGTPRTAQKIMLDVIIALVPAMIAAFVFFGGRSIAVIAVCVLTAVVSEFLFNKCVKQEQTISDLSAVVTGVLLALNIPADIPFWIAAVGSFFAIIAIKALFGGVGQNFANPAITARIFLLLSFSGAMTSNVFPATDTVSTATPLAILAGAEGTLPSYVDLFIGRCGGALGETSALALLIGGVYLLVRKVITWHTPVAFIGTVFVLSALLGQDALAQILTGGLMIGAIFMATDYATTPNTNKGKLVFGIGCGIITVLIRVYGSYPEGVSFSILLMNILTPFIERWTKTKPLGGADV